MATSPHQTMNEPRNSVLSFLSKFGRRSTLRNVGFIPGNLPWVLGHKFGCRDPRPPGSRLGCGHFQTHQAFRNMSMEASVAAFSWSIDVNAESTLTIIAILGMLVPRYPPLNCGFSILQHPLSTPFFKARFEIPGLNRHHKWCCKMYFGSPLECSYWPNPKTLDRPWSGPSRDPISRHRFGCHHRNGWDCKTTSVVGSWQ